MGVRGRAAAPPRLEPLLFALSPPHNLVRVLRPVVLAQALLMAARQAQLASGRAVGAQLVGHELVWCIALLLEQLSHEPQGSLRVAPGYIAFSVRQRVDRCGAATPVVPCGSRGFMQFRRTGSLSHSKAANG